MPSSRVAAYSELSVRRRYRRAGLASVATVAVVVAVAFALPAGAAQSPITLGTTVNFAVLAGSGITNTGPTTITGDVGTFPTPAETGTGTRTLHGADHAGDAVTQQAKTDLVTGYNDAAGRLPSTSVPTELGGRTLTPGVYTADAAGTLGITGTLTLNTQGNPAAVFVFKAASTLITAANSTVSAIGGGGACAYWQIGSSATLGIGSHLVGTLMALTSITATTGATVDGRLLARNGAVTLDANTITSATCIAAAAAPTTTTAVGATTSTLVGGATTTVPAGATTTLPGSATTLPGGATTTLPGTPVPPGSTGPPTLVRTGSDPRVAILGLLALATGGGLLVVSTRRRRRMHP